MQGRPVVTGHPHQPDKNAGAKGHTCRADGFWTNPRIYRLGQGPSEHPLATRRLVDRGLVGTVDEIFYLDEDELRAALLDDDVDAGALRAAIDERHRRFQRARQLSPPALIVNGRPKNPKTRSDDGVLSGTPASPGIASGTAVVVNDPFSRNSDSLPGTSISLADISPARSCSRRE